MPNFLKPILWDLPESLPIVGDLVQGYRQARIGQAAQEPHPSAFYHAFEHLLAFSGGLLGMYVALGSPHSSQPMAIQALFSPEAASALRTDIDHSTISPGYSSLNAASTEKMKLMMFGLMAAKMYLGHWGGTLTSRWLKRVFDVGRSSRCGRRRLNHSVNANQYLALEDNIAQSIENELHNTEETTRRVVN